MSQNAKRRPLFRERLTARLVGARGFEASPISALKTVTALRLRSFVLPSAASIGRDGSRQGAAMARPSGRALLPLDG